MLPASRRQHFASRRPRELRLRFELHWFVFTTSAGLLSFCLNFRL
jgi:hypothetical protein